MAAERDFSNWLTVLQPQLHRRARYLTANSADAKDLVQATSLRALEKRNLFVRGSLDGLTRWLLRIMANMHRDRLRVGHRETSVDWLDSVPDAPASGPPRWSTLEDDEVLAAVQRLDPRLRAVYELYAVQRCSYAAISSRLGIPISTVGTQIFRARDRLRRDLSGGALPMHTRPSRPRARASGSLRPTIV